jgi:INO80 complex subunit B
MHASSTIRWVMGPTGTVVTFPKEMGLPSIFDSKPCRFCFLLLIENSCQSTKFTRPNWYQRLLIDDMNSLRMCSYPPPREKCAGPSCTNPYKYRDSKSKLPLCSLQCYKAIQQQSQHETNWWRLKIYLHSHVNISYNYWGQASKEAFFIQYRGIIQIWMVHFLSSIA